MCRLLGVVSATPISRRCAVGDAVLKDFVALTKIHGDGWGVARVDRPATTRRPRCRRARALDDPHVRSPPPTTSGRPRPWSTCAGRPPASRCSRRTRIPSVADGLAMAHNGSIKPMAPLDDLLEPESPRRCAAPPTASATSALIRQHRRTAPDLAEAVRRAVAQLRQVYPDASLNALLLGEDQLIVVHAHARSPLPDEDIDGDHRRGSARRAPRGLLRHAAGPPDRRHAW